MQKQTLFSLALSLALAAICQAAPAAPQKEETAGFANGDFESADNATRTPAKDTSDNATAAAKAAEDEGDGIAIIEGTISEDLQTDDNSGQFKPADEMDNDEAEDERDAAADKQAVDQAVSQFYSSLNALFAGNVAPMQDVWSHTADVTYMGPVGGFEVGWQQVNNRWEEQAALRLGGHIEPKDLRITVGDDLASAQCFEVGNNVDGQVHPLQVSIRATSLFRKENGQWKMIGHHTDLLPYLEKEPPLNNGAINNGQ